MGWDWDWEPSGAVYRVTSCTLASLDQYNELVDHGQWHTVDYTRTVYTRLTRSLGYCCLAWLGLDVRYNYNYNYNYNSRLEEFA
jgi:hypothetical protein